MASMTVDSRAVSKVDSLVQCSVESSDGTMVGARVDVMVVSLGDLWVNRTERLMACVLVVESGWLLGLWLDTLLVWLKAVSLVVCLVVKLGYPLVVMLGVWKVLLMVDSTDLLEAAKMALRLALQKETR